MGVIKHHVEQYPGDQFVMDKKDNRTKISSEIIVSSEARIDRPARL
jgi:hypothetical protein